MSGRVGFDVVELGDSHVRLTVRSADDELAWRTVHAVADRVNDGDAAGMLSAIATYDTVLVEIDPLVSEATEVVPRLHELAAACRVDDPAPAARRFRVPVVYGGEHGPDLADVAASVGLEPDEVVARHVSLVHPVRCFSHNGAAMLDAPALPRPVPRRTDPRLVTPAGSVTLAGRQSLVLTCTQPSGWQIIGRTPVRLTNLARDTFTPYRPGDVFTYQAVTAEEAADLADVELGDLVDDDA